MEARYEVRGSVMAENVKRTSHQVQVPVYVAGGRRSEFSPETMVCAKCGCGGWTALGDGALCPECRSDWTIACGPVGGF